MLVPSTKKKRNHRPFKHAIVEGRVYHCLTFFGRLQKVKNIVNWGNFVKKKKTPHFKVLERHGYASVWGGGRDYRRDYASGILP